MRHLLPSALRLAAVAAHAGSSCTPVLEATTRDFETPSHRVTTATIGAPAAKRGETIHSGTQRDVRMRGTWRVSPMSKDERLQQSQENADDSRCKVLREAAVNGEPATVYQVTNDDAGSGEYCISQRSGLVAKEELDLGAGSHRSVRVDYGRQQAPAVEP